MRNKIYIYKKNEYYRIKVDIECTFLDPLNANRLT